jgi:hypothetical protein
MTEATPTLPHITIWARELAKREVKAQWRARGLKPWDIEASELAKAARTYLSEHPELIEHARIELWEHCAKRLTDAQRKQR